MALDLDLIKNTTEPMQVIHAKMIELGAEKKDLEKRPPTGDITNKIAQIDKDLEELQSEFMRLETEDNETTNTPIPINVGGRRRARRSRKMVRKGNRKSRRGRKSRRR